VHQLITIFTQEAVSIHTHADRLNTEHTWNGFCNKKMADNGMHVP